MPAILSLQQIIDSLEALDDEELRELREEIDIELEERGDTQQLEDEDEDDEEDEL